MRIFALHPALDKLSRQPVVKPSPRAQDRLKTLKTFELLSSKGVGVAEACTVLEVSRASLYRWRKRLKEHGLRGLEPRSTRPKRVRKACWPVELAARVESLRQRHPMWGKQKLTVLLRREGYRLSESTVGRILSRLIRRGVIATAPQMRRANSKRRKLQRCHARHKPKDLTAALPGDLLQLDSLHLSLGPGQSVKQFTAYCPVSRLTLAEVYSSATAHAAKRFLHQVLEELPFAVKAIQVDGGSEFMAEFERECQARELPLYVLPPRSPKLNGAVERNNGAWRYEFYWVSDLPTTLRELRPQVKAFQNLYNSYRPHGALHGLTPMEYLQTNYPGLASKSQMC